MFALAFNGSWTVVMDIALASGSVPNVRYGCCFAWLRFDEIECANRSTPFDEKSPTRVPALPQPYDAAV